MAFVSQPAVDGSDIGDEGEARLVTPEALSDVVEYIAGTASFGSFLIGVVGVFKERVRAVVVSVGPRSRFESVSDERRVSTRQADRGLPDG